ncbi:hypothetical protein OSX66_07890 [Staphylococcus agnetis]|uniref:coagulase domain-containing protein n=1 Tax=Staphylococcus agnetis TaxID=985762 RepID=UPI0024183DBF|nr:coagulase domain-containing protein [Staphylococcus agnetis]MDG4943813.1 hypothetical protein [Staphylococcus agnetis]
MKKKLLVLSASAILASNFILDNNASAVVSDSNSKSDAWEVQGNKKYDVTLKRYLDHFDDLLAKLTVGNHSGYEQPEYNKAYQRYQKGFLTEFDALVKFVLEDDRTVEYFPKKDPNQDLSKLGLTHERYNKIYKNIEKNREEFEKEVRGIEKDNKDLQRFIYSEQTKANDEIYELEHKVLMVAFAFSEYKEAKWNLYNKLDMIMAYQLEEKKYLIPQNVPTNNRMLREMKEDLETIIDEFFAEIELARPVKIPMLSKESSEDTKLIHQLRNDAKAAKLDSNLVDPTVKEREDRATKRLEELTKNSREAKAEAERKAYATKTKKSYTKNPEAFPHKHLKNQLLIQYPDVAQPVTTYTESITQTPQPVLKQQNREETFTIESAPRLNQSKPLNGLNGESNFVTMDVSANASTQFGSNGHVFEYSFDSTPKTTNVAKQNVKQENYNSVNNLAGMSGESQYVDFTQDSNPTTTYGGYGNAFDLTEDTAPKQPETITESHEIVFDEYTDITVSGFTKGESIEDTNVPTQTNQKN